MSSRPASPAIPITVPIVSKKSDSMTDRTMAIAVPVPRALQKSKVNFPRRLKLGAGQWCGTTAEPSVKTLRCLISFTIVASTVVKTIPRSSAPLIFFATSAAVTTKPMAKMSSGHDRKLWTIVTGTPGGPGMTTPAFTKPISAMNRPIPMPMDRLRSIGIAFRTASRNPVSTRAVMTRPSVTITPIAWGQVSPLATTRVNATNAFSPSPAAMANG